jgi:O-antigen ligase
MTSATFIYPLQAAWRRSNAVLRGIAIVFSITLFTIVALAFTDPEWNLFQFLFGCAIFFTALCLARPFSGRASLAEKEAFLSSALVIWWFLMVSEAMFSHAQSTASAAKGNVGLGAMYQALSWILSAAVLVFITWFRPSYLRRLFIGPLKWVSIFAIVVVISCPLSPKPVYSLALAFKLCVIVLTLHAIGEAIIDETGISRLFAGIFLATLIIATKAIIAELLDPNAFKSDRLPNVGLSGTCGVLLLLCLLYFVRKKNLLFLMIGMYSLVVMISCGTKGGMVASFVSLMMFFVLLKRPAQALAAGFVFAIIFILCLIFTPLGKSLEKYSEGGSATTLTGRTNLWANAWPNIESHPILGNGYRASRFLSEDVPGAFQDAGNMHNSFLEVLYNNGLAGLIPIVVIIILTVVNLKSALLRPPTLQLRYYAVATLALETHLFVWGIVAVTFGGQPDDRFMDFFAMLLVSMFLRSQCDKQYLKTVYGNRRS